MLDCKAKTEFYTSHVTWNSSLLCAQTPSCEWEKGFPLLWFLSQPHLLALVYRAYKLSTTWLGFHEKITKLMDILQKNPFPAHLIERVVHCYITRTQNNHCPQGSFPTTSPTFYFKLLYMTIFLSLLKKRFTILSSAILQWFRHQLVFSSCKIGNMHVWHKIPYSWQGPLTCCLQVCVCGL